MHTALLLADKGGGAQHEAVRKNKGIKEEGSSGIHLVDTNSRPCLQFISKSRVFTSKRLLIMKPQNNLHNDGAPV